MDVRQTRSIWGPSLLPPPWIPGLLNRTEAVRDICRAVTYVQEPLFYFRLLRLVLFFDLIFLSLFSPLSLVGQGTMAKYLGLTVVGWNVMVKHWWDKVRRNIHALSAIQQAC